ncbi:hypothetical protein SAMN05444156_3225 [Verrucomicrobium sp. GAS474]|uniref:hypothetical protein n=1 Tax=Verrucomicrobium sp. GAS474 TaxID=1882831 RepID=UPI0008795490|nr:hypothetical protein [Verrucomicrobium sp. GAS474]SDU31170.1 hypothetical protein SAMN05444156_3225 [Verrucomicrobium sp. GAS474]
MSITLTVDTTRYAALVRDLAKRTGRTVQKELKVAARGLCWELAKAMQPFGMDDKAKGQGESAIRRDLFGSGQKGLTSSTVRRFGIFKTLPDSIIANATEEESTTVQIFAKKNGEVYGTDKEHFMRNPSVGDLDAIHHSAFRDGRMSSVSAFDRTIGRWKFITRTVIPESKGVQILNMLVARVGFAKAGWATCARIIGDAANSTRDFPRWVKRHRDAPGEVEDRTDDPNQPTLTIVNNINYTRRVLSQQNMSIALKDAEYKLRARIQNAIDHPPKSS